MNRRFLHVLVKSFGNHPCPYSLHSINASSFLSIHRRQDRSMDHQEIKVRRKWRKTTCLIAPCPSIIPATSVLTVEAVAAIAALPQQYKQCDFCCCYYIYSQSFSSQQA
ncbi:Os01g0226633 [Oryza sativa Japonica Group]|uniref:Os01g0226633 protein n=1 Tax=Oryza sativa subsp. japonica TaxID=39947 RepID=A0A0P0V0G4_ORYSJ|nr:Os01g0226633 [Oryza sativa Japonica Group]